VLWRDELAKRVDPLLDAGRGVERVPPRPRRREDVHLRHGGDDTRQLGVDRVGECLDHAVTCRLEHDQVVRGRPHRSAHDAVPLTDDPADDLGIDLRLRASGREQPQRQVVPGLVGEQDVSERVAHVLGSTDLLDVDRTIVREPRWQLEGHVVCAAVAATALGEPGYGSLVRVSAKVDYALRAMLELAAEGGLVKGEQLATAQEIPQKFLEAILVDLRHAELVASRRGVDGGYALAKPASEISVADVIRAVEGPIATVRGARPDDVVYNGAARALAPVWIELRAAMRDVLEETTLADLVARSAGD